MANISTDLSLSLSPIISIPKFKVNPQREKKDRFFTYFPEAKLKERTSQRTKKNSKRRKWVDMKSQKRHLLWNKQSQRLPSDLKKFKIKTPNKLCFKTKIFLPNFHFKRNAKQEKHAPKRICKGEVFSLFNVFFFKKKIAEETTERDSNDC